MTTKENSLHRLSVGTLVALIIQIGAVVWWASGVSASVETLEAQIQHEMVIEKSFSSAYLLWKRK